MRVAIIGSGISGLSSAFFLAKKNKVDIFEKNNRLGGHTHTHKIKLDNEVNVDSGFIVFNKKNYPNLTKLFNELGLEFHICDMSLSVHTKDFQWSSKKFSKAKSLLSLKNLKFISEIIKFNYLAKSNSSSEPIEKWIKKNNFSKNFSESYLYPMIAAIWSGSSERMKDYPASSLANFLNNHGLLNLFRGPQWFSIKGGSNQYIEKIIEKGNLNNIFLDSKVAIVRNKNKIILENDGEKHEYDKLIMACNAKEIIGSILDLGKTEISILKNFAFTENKVCLHTDESLMPSNKEEWCSWNVNKDSNSEFVTYWMNNLQDLKTSKNIFVSIGDFKIRDNQEHRNMIYEHPFYNLDTFLGQKNVDGIQGLNNTFYCGAYLGYGFHEDGINSALKVSKLIEK